MQTELFGPHTEACCSGNSRGLLFLGLLCSVPLLGHFTRPMHKGTCHKIRGLAETSRENDTHHVLDRWYHGRLLSDHFPQRHCSPLPGAQAAPAPAPTPAPKLLGSKVLALFWGSSQIRINFEETLAVRGRFGLMPPQGRSCDSLVTSCVHRSTNTHSRHGVCAGVGNGSCSGTIAA